MSHVPDMNESRPTYRWVISHIWITHVTHSTLGVTWQKRLVRVDNDRIWIGKGMWVASLDGFTHETWLIHVKKHDSYMYDDTYISKTWLIHVNQSCLVIHTRFVPTYSYVGQASYISVARLFWEWSNMDRQKYVGHRTWLIHIWDMKHSYMGHDWFIYGTWLIHLCDMIHCRWSNMVRQLYVGHDSFICVERIFHLWGTD